MKKNYPFAIVLFFLLGQQIISAQISTLTATYTAGHIASDFNNNPTTANNATCPGVLTVNVPVGRYVTSVSVEYDIEALGFGFISEQRSYLECVTTGMKEGAVSVGPSIFTGGIQGYNRTGLAIGNGIVPAGGLQFKLHVFRTFSSGNCQSNIQRVNNNTFKITVNHAPAPTCPPPSAVAVGSIGTNSATLSWTTGGATNWQVEYGANGFVPGTGTIVNAATNPFVLAGLSPSTNYDFRVRDSCGIGDVSFWSPAQTFKTNCAVIAAPWNEDFESLDWVPGGFNDNGDIDTCFSRNYSNFFTMISGPPSFSSSFSGPSGDHTTGSGQYVFSERVVFGTFPATAEITTPPIDLSPLNIPELSFWYHMFGSNIDSFQVGISNDGGVNFTVLYTKVGQQQSAKNDPWKEAVLNLAAYANDTIVLKFKSIQATNGVNGDVAIDDIDIHEQPSCPKPSGLTVTGSTTNTISLSWNSGGATAWQIEYGVSGFTLGTGTIVNVTSNPVTIPGFLPSTSYDFYVRDSCGIGDVSAWSVAITGNTACAPVAAPYFQNFDNSNWNRGPNFNSKGTLDTCWVRVPMMLYFFKSGPPQFLGASGADVDHTPGTAIGKYIYSERTSFTGSLDTARVSSPPIDLGPLNVAELTFWYHMFGADIGTLTVEVTNNGGSTYTTVYTRSGQQQTSTADAWKEAIVNLSAFANDTVQVRFSVVHLNFGINAAVSIDDFDIHEAPTCPKPQDLAMDMIWSDKAVISWTSGGASQWEVEYGAPNFVPGNGTRVAASSNPFTLTGLSVNTSYDIYVRDSCAVGDVSVWVGPLRIKTQCAPSVTPYMRDFEGLVWGPGPFFNDTGFVHPCWRRNPLDDYLWKGGPPPFTSFNTGPDIDHTLGTSSGKYLFTASIGFSSIIPKMAEIESDIIDLSALTVPEMSFWYHMFGGDIGDLEVFVTTGDGVWNSVWTKSGQQQSSGADAWKEAVVNISAYAGDTIKLRFRATKNFTGNQAEIALDDLSIHEQPSCPKPQNLAIVGKTNSTVTLAWLSGGSTDWNIEYGSPGFVPGTGTIVNATSNPFTVTGLSANTGYEFYVRDSCGVGDVSDWIGPVGDTTDCNPIAAPYFENFDGPTFVIGSIVNPGDLDACWSRDETRNYQWAPENTTTLFASGPDADHTTGSGKFLHTQRTFGSTNPSQEAMVFSPLIDLTPLTTPELSFWYHSFGADIDSLVVDIFDGSSWNYISTIVGQQQNAKTDPWKEAILNISAFANDTIKVRFTAYRNGIFAFNSIIAIDDLDIHEQPTCPKPSALAVTGMTATTVSLSWTSGGASNWQIEYGLSGFASGSGTIVTATTNPFTVTGLNSSTTYDFYVRDSCGATDVSDWFGTATGATDCLPLLAPFTETFDGTPWLAGPGFNDTGEVAQCWPRTPLVDYLWKSGPPSFTSTFTGPAADHTTGFGKFIFTESIFSGGTPPFDAYIETPDIDLTALTVPELSFWYHMFGTGVGTLTVEVDDGSGYVSVFTKTGQQQNSGIDPWKEAILNLAAYANDTIKIRFKGTQTAFSTLADVAIDDVDIHEAPSCPKSQNLVILGKTNSTVTLQWLGGGATNWNVEYGSPGFSHGAGTVVNATTNPFTVTGLSANTGYEFYVRDSCGLGDVSDWSNPAADTTNCNPVAAPFFEDFDGPAYVVGSFASPGSIDPCWEREGGINYQWAPETTSPTFGTGPDNDHTTGNGKFLFTQRLFGTLSQSASTKLMTPLIDLTPLNVPELSFWYFTFGNDIDSLVVEIFDGSSWNHGISIIGAQQTSGTDSWKEAIVNLSAYANDTIKVRFTGYRATVTAFSSVIAIDDVDIHEQPSCPKPQIFTSAGHNHNSVTLQWQTGGATNWNIEYGPAGFILGTGTIINTTTNPHTINGLIPGNIYEFYVRDSCGVGDVSMWEGPLSDTTSACDTATTCTYTVDLSDSFGDGWNNSIVTFFQNSAAVGQVGAGFTGGSTFGPVNINLCDNMNTYAVLTTRGNFPQEIGFEVTDPNIISVATHLPTFGLQAGDTLATFLSSCVVSTCPPPTNVTVNSSTLNSITLSWITGVGVTNWLVGYRVSGSTAPLTILPTSTNPFTVSGLNPSTTYDFYVKDSCGVGNVSVWQMPVSGTTLCGTVSAPWIENFDGPTWISGTGLANAGNQISSCWTRPTTSNLHFGTGTGATSSANTGPDFDVSGTGNYIYAEASAGTGAGEITSPWVHIPNAMGNPQLTFSYHMFGGNITSLVVQIDNGSGFGPNVITLNGQQQTSSTDPWKVDTLDLNTYIGDTIRIKFIGTNSGFTGDIAVDAVRIGDSTGSQCGDPSNIAFSAITVNSANVSWTSLSGISDVEVVPMGQAQGTGTMYSGVTSPLAINSLLANTTYIIYVRDSCGSGNSSLWISDTLLTNPCPAIGGTFGFTINLLSANFNSFGVTNQDSVYWDFGDGNNSSLPNPLHTYGAAGSYTVQLSCFSDCGSTQSIFDTIMVCDSLLADFSFTQTGDTVLFDASLSTGASSFHWDFSGVDDTTGTTVKYKFPTAGNKSVTLTAYNLCGDSIKVTKNVAVCLAPIAKWTYTLLGTTGAGMKVQFDGSASQNAVTFDWDFGDGNIASGSAQPVHTYLTPGLFYIVKLTVSNTCADVNSMTYKLSEIGLEEYDLSSTIELYPNPAKDRVEVSWTAEDYEMQNIEVMDISGRCMLLFEIDRSTSGKKTLDVSALVSGYYIIRFNTDQGVEQRKLMID